MPQQTQAAILTAGHSSIYKKKRKKKIGRRWCWPFVTSIHSRAFFPFLERAQYCYEWKLWLLSSLPELYFWLWSVYPEWFEPDWFILASDGEPLPALADIRSEGTAGGCCGWQTRQIHSQQQSNRRHWSGQKHSHKLKVHLGKEKKKKKIIIILLFFS